MELGPHVHEGSHMYSVSVISTGTYTFSHRVELAGLKEDGIDHPNLDDFFHPHLDLFLINRHFACSAL